MMNGSLPRPGRYEYCTAAHMQCAAKSRFRSGFGGN
jgi:hypothetical protein